MPFWQPGQKKVFIEPLTIFFKFRKCEKNVIFSKKNISLDFWQERLSVVLTALPEVCRQQTGIFWLKVQKSKTQIFLF